LVYQISIVEQYRRICGIKHGPSRDRKATIALIKQILSNKNDLTPMDAMLLDSYTTVSSADTIARWLLNNRRPVPIDMPYKFNEQGKIVNTNTDK
jgi:hypothetical protein